MLKYVILFLMFVLVMLVFVGFIASYYNSKRINKKTQTKLMMLRVGIQFVVILIVAATYFFYRS